MKSVVLNVVFLLALFGLSANAFSQNWELLPVKTSIKLNDVYFFDRDTGFACGDKGLILRTTNGGFNWQTVVSGVNDKLANIFFVNRNLAYITGFVGNGTFLKSTDGGNSWQNVSLNKPDTRSAGVWFTSPSTGFYALGNKFYQNSVIYKTINGGLNWDTVFKGKEWITYLYFLDENFGFATASGSDIYHTKDGGNSWDTIHFQCDMWMSGIHFFNKDTGFVSGLDMGSNCMSIMKTIDGGKSWVNVADSGAARLYFKNPGMAYAIYPDTSGQGILMKSTDSGNNWFVEPTPKNMNISICFPENEIGYVVGDSGYIAKYSKKHVLTGNVKFKSNGVSAGFVKIFSYSKQQKSLLIDSVSLSAAGEFTMNNVLPGKYLLYAQADIALYPTAIGTYFGDKELWQEAAILEVYGADTFICNINLSETNNITAGSASISGVVVSLDGTRAGTSPIKDVDVTLKKVPGGEIKKDKSNDTGYYNFENLPLGNYMIYIDIPGLPMDSLVPVEIKEKDSNVKHINFGVDSIGIHPDVSLSVFNTKELLIGTFPNPVLDLLKIHLPETSDYLAELIDVNGRTVKSVKSQLTNEINIDISDLPPSIYVLKVKQNQRVGLIKVLKL